MTRFAICTIPYLNAEVFPGRAYRVVADSEAESNSMIRIIDESGENYEYPAKYFVIVERK